MRHTNDFDAKESSRAPYSLNCWATESNATDSSLRLYPNRKRRALANLPWRGDNWAHLQEALPASARRLELVHAQANRCRETILTIIRKIQDRHPGQPSQGFDYRRRFGADGHGKIRVTLNDFVGGIKRR